MNFIKLFFTLFFFICFLHVSGQSVAINEVVASNKSGLKDDNGEYSDWIEFQNTSSSAINLAGWSVTDDRKMPGKWVFPDVVIPGGAYLVVFASEKDRKTDVNYLHTNFKLNEKGEFLALYNNIGVKVSEVSPYPGLKDDQSAGLFGGRWTVFTKPTPGAFNTHLNLAELPSPFFSEKYGIHEKPFYLNIYSPVDFASIYYTTDGSAPSKINGKLYTGPILIDKTTVIRAITVVAENVSYDFTPSKVQTRSFIFLESLYKQPNNPEGYPYNWGLYTYTSARAIADYEMDQELTSESLYKDKIRETMYNMPVISLVTHKKLLFGGDADPDSGGIYIYTAPPIGGFSTGRDWERPVSFEYIDNVNNIYLQEDCGLQIHGGHSRLPEKSPKHSFRVSFKSEFGSPKLFYPLFGENQTTEINSFILRAGYGNTWLHMSEGERNIAIYTRDAWAKRTKSKMGHISTNTQYAHLFINGMYWGLYNPNERINDDYLADYLGGDKSDYDIIKEDESGSGIHASDGTIDAWNLLLDLSSKAADNDIYNQILDRSLLDLDDFIDYMLLNFYGANGDWDHHNWIAFRSRVNPGSGFRFFCWDSEHVIKSLGANILNENNARCPSRIFQNLMLNENFKKKVDERILATCYGDGALTSKVALETWNKLASEVDVALFAEAARWGDYRKDVHQYTSTGKLYRKEVHYDARAKYMREEFFPKRTNEFITHLRKAGWLTSDEPTSLVDIFEGSNDIKLSNYPNPFNSATTIFYSLKSDCEIELSVYDLSGRKVETLYEGMQQQGAHNFSFDTSKLSKGTYVCRIVLKGNNANTAILKMVKL